jgi:hypothetical protein
LARIVAAPVRAKRVRGEADERGLLGAADTLPVVCEHDATGVEAQMLDRQSPCPTTSGPPSASARAPSPRRVDLLRAAARVASKSNSRLCGRGQSAHRPCARRASAAAAAIGGERLEQTHADVERRRDRSGTPRTTRVRRAGRACRCSSTVAKPFANASGPARRPRRKPLRFGDVRLEPNALVEHELGFG